MKLVIQRVSSASVTVDGTIKGNIDKGLLILLGVSQEDDGSQIEWLVKKVVEMRIFNDDHGKMNRSLIEVNGSILVISQFTLYANCHKGRRPSFVKAALPEKAENLYNRFIQQLLTHNITVETGVFGAHMDVSLCNDGPVTIILEK